MPDNKSLSGGQDRKRINVNEDYEVRDWAKKFAVSPEKLKEAVAAVSHRLGNSAAVCRKAYIHPAVIALGDSLTDTARRAQLLARPWAGRAPTVRGLATPERRMLALLHDLATG